MRRWHEDDDDDDDEEEEADTDQKEMQTGSWKRRSRRKVWATSRGSRGALVNVPQECRCEEAELRIEGEERRWKEPRKGQTGDEDELVQEMLMRGVDLRGRIFEVEGDGNCFYHAIMTEILARYGEVIAPEHKEWAAGLYHHGRSHKRKELSDMLRWWTWKTQRAWFNEEWRSQFEEDEGCPDWMVLQAEASKTSNEIEGSWWVRDEHTDVMVVAPLLALGLGLNISIIDARGEGGGRTTIRSQQYGLKGAEYKEQLKEKGIVGMGDEALGTMMTRERELMDRVDQDRSRVQFLKRVVYARTVTLPRETAVLSSLMRNQYADLFGRELLRETTMDGRRGEREREAGRERMKSAPVITLAFFKYQEQWHHFTNVQDVNVELRKLVNNDSKGAREEMSERLNQMFEEYRRTGMEEYEKAVNVHKQAARKAAEKQKREAERMKKETARRRADERRRK